MGLAADPSLPVGCCLPQPWGVPQAQCLKSPPHVLSLQEMCSSRWQRSTGRSRTSWRRW